MGMAARHGLAQRCFVPAGPLSLSSGLGTGTVGVVGLLSMAPLTRVALVSTLAGDQLAEQI